MKTGKKRKSKPFSFVFFKFGQIAEKTLQTLEKWAMEAVSEAAGIERLDKK